MADKFSNYVPNTVVKDIQFIGLVIIYVGCYMSKSVYYDVKYEIQQFISRFSYMNGLMVSTRYQRNGRNSVFYIYG
jgi:hypothetical protein